MQLINLNLETNFKKLKGGSRFNFKNEQIICLSGENGSGKTILLKLVTDMLCSALEKNILLDEELVAELKVEIGGNEYVLKKIKGKKNVNIYDNNGIEIETLKEKYNIIIYSSGKRSSLSDTYYNMLIDLIKDDTKGIIKNVDNYYLREKIKKYIILYLFIFEEELLKKYLDNLIKISTINNIEIFIKLDKNINKNLIDSVKDIFDITNKKDLEKGIKITVNTEKIKKIKKTYEHNSFNFFKFLEQLEHENIKNIKNIESYENLDFISEKIEDNYLSSNFFIENIEFENGVSFKYLSEGELQLLETLGCMLLFQSKEIFKENIFIYDEPTTHLNVNWMSKYVTKLKEILTQKSKYSNNKINSQLIFTTHNVEVISDLPRKNINLIKGGIFKSIKLETLGGSSGYVSKNLFEKQSVISDNAKKEIEMYYEKLDYLVEAEDIEKEIDKIERSFGTSSEKALLINYALDKISGDL